MAAVAPSAAAREALAALVAGVPDEPALRRARDWELLGRQLALFDEADYGSVPEAGDR